MRQPLGVENGNNPINDFDNIDDGNFMGGYSVAKSKTRRRKTKKHSKKTHRTRRRRRGFFGVFGRRRRTRRVSRRRTHRKGLTSGGKVKYTKHGQPYIIMKNGRAKFIKGKRHK